MHRITTREGIDIAYEDNYFGAPWDEETAETVVLVHGTGESSRVWFEWVPPLTARYRVLRPDMPGFGASRIPAEVPFDWAAANMARQLKQVVDAANAGPVHLVGAKYGGSVGVEFASQFPEAVRSLTVISGPMRVRGVGGPVDVETFAARIEANLRRWVDETMPDRLGSGASEAQRRWWSDLMAGSDMRATRESAIGTVALELLDTLSAVKAPTQFMTSQGNRMLSADVYREWVERAPTAKLVMVSGDSYHPAAANAPECIAAALDHIARHSRV